jgi:hypothetical protein
VENKPVESYQKRVDGCGSLRRDRRRVRQAKFAVRVTEMLDEIVLPITEPQTEWLNLPI